MPLSRQGALAEGKRLILVGFSNGGTIAQWYIANKGLPEPEKLVLISQATNAVWGRVLGGAAWPACNNGSHWDLMGPLYPTPKRKSIVHERGVVAHFIADAFANKRTRPLAATLSPAEGPPSSVPTPPHPTRARAPRGSQAS